MLYVHCSPNALSHWLPIDLSPTWNGGGGGGWRVEVNELGGVETSTSLVKLEESAQEGSEVHGSSEGDDWWD